MRARGHAANDAAGTCHLACAPKKVAHDVHATAAANACTRSAFIAAAAALGFEEIQHHSVPLLGSVCSRDKNEDKQRKALLATAQALGFEEVGPRSCMGQVRIGPRDALPVTAQALGLEELFLESPVYNNAGTHTDDSFFGVCRCTQECPRY